MIPKHVFPLIFYLLNEAHYFLLSPYKRPVHIRLMAGIKNTYQSKQTIVTFANHITLFTLGRPTGNNIIWFKQAISCLDLCACTQAKGI